MVDYRNLRIGQDLLLSGSDAYGNPVEMECKVSKMFKDHAIATDGKAEIWIDRDTENLFYPIEKNQDGNIVHKNVIPFPKR